MTEQSKITLTYLNIRQSIVILLTKLIFTDILLATIVISFFFGLAKGEPFFGISFMNPPLFLTVFISIGVIKILLSIYIILLWLNEYYEITPEYVIHKQGIIFRKTESYRVDHIRRIEIQDTLLGELLNFATVTLYDIRLNKYLEMYVIHNPDRYVRVLKELRPNIEIGKQRIRLPFVPKQQNGYIEPSE